MYSRVFKIDIEEIKLSSFKSDSITPVVIYKAMTTIATELDPLKTRIL